MNNELKADFVSDLAECEQMLDTASSQIYTSPNSQDHSDDSDPINDVRLIQSNDVSRRTSSSEMHCETCKVTGTESSLFEDYEKLLVNFEPRQTFNSLQHFADIDFNIYTELRNDLWDDIFPIENKFTKGPTQHLATSVKSLQELTLFTAENGHELKNLNSEQLLSVLVNQQIPIIEYRLLKCKTKLLEVPLYNVNFKILSPKGLSDVDAHPLTTGKSESYDELNYDVWNEIFPVKTQQLRLQNQSMQDLCPLSSPQALISDLIPHSSCANQLQIFKDYKANKRLEFELSTKTITVTGDEIVQSFQSENSNAVNSPFDYANEVNANIINTTVANLGQSLVISLDKTLNENSGEDEYNFNNEYAYITIDYQQENDIGEQSNSAEEILSSPQVNQITSTRVLLMKNWINSKGKQLSRMRCLGIGGILFVLLLASVAVIIALFLNNQFNVELKFLHNPRLLGVVSVGRYLTGVTVLDSQLFAVGQGSSEVKVYNTNSLKFIRNITVTGSSSLHAIVSSSQCNCLFISDLEQSRVYRFNLYNNVTSSWLVGGPCYGLSLTSTNNVLVTVWNTKPIKEYTPEGTLVREISLDSSIEHPVHSLLLASGQFVVAHGLGGLLHRVCIVDTSGSIVQSYGGSRGAGVGQLNTPTNLAVDTRNNVFIADWYNNRVVLLSPSLTHRGYITIPGHNLSRPQALHLDVPNRRLYIGEQASHGRVYVLTP